MVTTPKNRKPLPGSKYRNNWSGDLIKSMAWELELEETRKLIVAKGYTPEQAERGMVSFLKRMTMGPELYAISWWHEWWDVVREDLSDHLPDIN